MKTRKILSVILCIATILSLMTCCLMGGASARTYASYADVASLTFDTGNAGIAYNRAGYSFEYRDSGDSDHGRILHSKDTSGGAALFLGKNDSASTTADLLPLEGETTYRLTFDYRYCQGSFTTTDGDKSMTSFRFATNVETPTTFKDGLTNEYVTEVISARVDVVPVALTETPLAADTDWATASFTFTTAEFAEGTNLYMAFKSPQAYSKKDGVWNGTSLYFDLDNIMIEKVTKSVTCGTKAGTLFDMDTAIDAAASSASYEIVSDPDTESGHGNVLKVTSDGDHPRMSLSALKVQMGHKYYLSYDVKVASGEQQLVNIVAQYGQASSFRVFVATTTGGYGAKEGLTYYVNGTATKDHTQYKANTTWQRVGVYLDLTTGSNLYAAISSDNNNFTTAGVDDKGVSKGWLRNLTLHFGAGKSGTVGYFDNIQLFDITEAETNKPTATVTADYSARSADSKDGAGIRFRGTFNNSDIENAAEIGFVVATTVAAAEHSDWYKVETGAKSYALTTVCKNDTVNTVYETKDGKTSYQLILTGLKSGTNTAYELPFDVAMYVKDASGNYTYYYLGQSSYNEVLAAYSAQNITMPTK